MSGFLRHLLCRDELLVTVIPPGESGFIHQLGNTGQADAHMADQAVLFRTFTYKPMRLQ